MSLQLVLVEHLFNLFCRLFLRSFLWAFLHLAEKQRKRNCTRNPQDAFGIIFHPSPLASQTDSRTKVGSNFSVGKFITHIVAESVDHLLSVKEQTTQAVIAFIIKLTFELMTSKIIVSGTKPPRSGRGQRGWVELKTGQITQTLRYP